MVRWHVSCFYNKQQLHSAKIIRSVDCSSTMEKNTSYLSPLYSLFLLHYSLLFSLSLPFLSLQLSITLFCISSPTCINLITTAWEGRIIGTLRGHRRQNSRQRRGAERGQSFRKMWICQNGKGGEITIKCLLKYHVHSPHFLYHRLWKMNSTYAAQNQP